jgi:integrase
VRSDQHSVGIRQDAGEASAGLDRRAGVEVACPGQVGAQRLGGSTAVVRGRRVEGTTKGGRSRVVSIDAETVAVLREFRRQQAEERQAAGTAWNGSDDLVFTNRWGEPLYPDTVTALMNKLIAAHNESVSDAGQALPHTRLHDLRHLHATTLLLAGIPVHVVAARLGHADPAVTLRVTRTCCASTRSALGTSSPRL